MFKHLQFNFKIYIIHTYSHFHGVLKLFAIFLIEKIHTSLFLSAPSIFEKMNFICIDIYLYVYL